MQWKDLDFRPPHRTLRQFGGLCLVVFGALAAVRFWRVGATPMAWTLLALAVVPAVLGAIRPQALRWFFVGWMIVAWPVGWLVSHVVLAVLYWGLFTPLAIVFRLVGRDALQLRGRDRPSYWLAKSTPTDLRRYFRQY